MQTPTLPIQVSGASAQPAAARGNGNGAEAATPFSQTLSQAHAQRSKDHAPAPQAAKPATPAVPPKQANAERAAPAKPAEPAKANSADTAAGAKAEGQDGSTAVDTQAKDDADAAAAAAAAQGEMPVADMLALVASFLPEKAASVVKDTSAAEAIAIRAARAADLVPAARAAQAAEVVDTAAAPFDAALADSAAAVTADGKEAEAGQAALLAMSQARPEGMGRGRGVTDNAAPKTVPPSASEGIARTDGVAKESGIAALPAERSAPDAALADQPVFEARTQASGAAQQPAVRTQPEAAIAARPAAPAAFDNMVREAAPAPVAAPVQQASLNIAQAASGMHTDKIAARVGTPGWDNQVGQKIVWMVAGKEQSATLTLNPPDLGPMQVVLSVTNDQASVTFSSAQPEVRAALENAMPRLREMLDESGVALSNASVNAGMPDQRQAQGEPGRAGNNGNGNGGNGLGRSEANGSAAEAAARTAARPGGGNGLVDTFA